MTNAEVLEQLERQITATGAQIEKIVYASSAVHMTIRSRRDTICIQGVGSQWGFSMNWPDAEAWMGHDQVFDSLEAALTHVLTLVGDASSSRPEP